MNPTFVLVRTMQCAFIVSVLLFAFVLHIIHPAPHSVSASLQWGIVFCAAASALMGFIVQGVWSRSPIKLFRRRRMLPFAVDGLQDTSCGLQRRSPWLCLDLFCA